ncbi:MAG TPA: acetyl-coenzyme A synthetase, partial [Thermoplasmata archaeon]|nr:acetyl-coenzyme A synthetase [Thermoplasmata archaeon]
AEAAVCGAADEARGEVPVAFVVLRTGVDGTSALADVIAETVAERIGRIARPARVHFVRALPKTRSGKIMRRVAKAVADGRTDVGDVTTLEEAGSVEEIRAALARLRSEVGPPP